MIPLSINNDIMNTNLHKEKHYFLNRRDVIIIVITLGMIASIVYMFVKYT